MSRGEYTVSLTTVMLRFTQMLSHVFCLSVCLFLSVCLSVCFTQMLSHVFSLSVCFTQMLSQLFTVCLCAYLCLSLSMSLSVRVFHTQFNAFTRTLSLSLVRLSHLSVCLSLPLYILLNAGTMSFCV